jgi:hypothetical protein
MDSSPDALPDLSGEIAEEARIIGTIIPVLNRARNDHGLGGVVSVIAIIMLTAWPLYPNFRARLWSDRVRVLETKFNQVGYLIIVLILTLISGNSQMRRYPYSGSFVPLVLLRTPFSLVPHGG